MGLSTLVEGTPRGDGCVNRDDSLVAYRGGLADGTAHPGVSPNRAAGFKLGASNEVDVIANRDPLLDDTALLDERVVSDDAELADMRHAAHSNSGV